jgi:molybdopterin molybdotransferase
VPIEQTSPGSDRVVFREPTVSGRFIARQGNEARAGDVVLKAGTPMGPAQIAVAAAIGAATVPVFAAPSVAVLSTGDELVPFDKTPLGPQIRSSNTPMLLALLARYHCRAIDLGIAPDDPEQIRASIVAGLQHDVLLISGGMSMGAHDYVPAILRQLGADLKITKLRIKPGKPFVFAQMPGGKFVFGLPGNPVSAFVCTARLVSRLLAKIAGGKPRAIDRTGVLTSPLEANGPREFYQPAELDGQRLTPLTWKGSADIYALARASALIVRPENHPPQLAGAAVHFLEI